MKSNIVFVPEEEQYKVWLEGNPTKRYSQSQKETLDTELRTKIIKELNITGEYGIEEFMLYHKCLEVQKFVKKTNI